jgi:hypothetical protein
MTRGSVRLDVGFTDFGLLEFFDSKSIRRILMLDHLATTVWSAFARALREMQTCREAGASMRRFPPRDLPDYPRSSTALLLPSDSAQAFATAEFGSALPGIVAQPPFSTNLLWSHA